MSDELRHTREDFCKYRGLENTLAHVLTNSYGMCDIAYLCRTLANHRQRLENALKRL